MARIVVSDPLAEEGIQLLREHGHDVVDVSAAPDLKTAVADAEAWIIRSGTTLDANLLAAAPLLRAIGRAGVGVDNIDLSAATAQGVAVFHAPTGNITSAAEQAWALMLAAARRVPEADAAMKNEDWARKRLKGVELHGKTLFIVGLGRIGRMMAERAHAFGMATLGHDPFVTPEQAKAFGVEWVSIDDGLPRSDIITLHTPLTPQTKDLIDARRVALMKEGTLLVNAARGGLVDPDAVLAGLEDGRIAFAGIDVWPEEPPTDWRLAKHPRVVAAPHLGASTKEAQTKAAVQACQRVVDFLASGDAGLAVNAQASVPDAMRPWTELAQHLGAFAAQSLHGTLEGVVVGAPAGMDVEPLRVHALVGILTAGTDEPVNAINAPTVAAEKGWAVATKALPKGTDCVRLELRSGATTLAIEGTYTPHYGARVTRIDAFDVDFRPQGRFLLTRHDDVPGVLAAITRILADAEVNVADLSLSRDANSHEAVAVIRIDGSIPKQARDALRAVAHIREAHRMRV